MIFHNADSKAETQNTALFPTILVGINQNKIYYFPMITTRKQQIFDCFI